MVYHIFLSQIYSKNWSKQQSRLEKFQKIQCKVGLKKARFLKRLVPLRRSAVLCIKTKRKAALRASQELTRLHQAQAQEFESVNSFKRL
jgi:hypothetical protein